MKKIILLIMLFFFAVFDFCSALAGYSNASCSIGAKQYHFTCCPAQDLPYAWMTAYDFVAHERPRCNQANVYYPQCDASTPAELSSSTTLPAFCGASTINYSSGTPAAPAPKTSSH